MVERGILFDEAVGEFEKRFIKRVLERTNGNQCRAAELLGIHRNTLSRKMTEYKLDHRPEGAVGGENRSIAGQFGAKVEIVKAAAPRAALQNRNGPEFIIRGRCVS